MTKNLESIKVTQETTEALIPVQRMGEVALGEISTDEKEARRKAYLKASKTQDHGTAPTKKGRFKPEYYIGPDKTPDIRTKLNDKEVVAAVLDGLLDTKDLSPAEQKRIWELILRDQEEQEIFSELDSLEYQETEYDEQDDSDDDDNPSSIELQGREFSERLNIARKQNPADPYETIAVDEDRGDYLLDGMQIVAGRKGQ